MPENIVGILKSFKECWPCLFASNIVGKTSKQLRGIRIVEAIIIGLVLAGGNALMDSYKTEKTMMKEDTMAIMESQEAGFEKIMIRIDKNNSDVNDSIDKLDKNVNNIAKNVIEIETKQKDFARRIGRLETD